jgi:hypothetical protein
MNDELGIAPIIAVSATFVPMTTSHKYRAYAASL